MSWKARMSQVVYKLAFYVTPGKESLGPNTYLKYNYQELAHLNPGLDIVVRNITPGVPEIHAQYENGKRFVQPLHNFTAQQTEDALRKVIENGERHHQRILAYDRMKEFDIVDAMNPPKRLFWSQGDLYEP